MRDHHIIKLIEEQPLDHLSESEFISIDQHIAECLECKQSYEAARVSTLLIKERVAQTVDPSPFFKTRVMAAIRENRLSAEPAAIVRMWRAAGAMVSAMVMLVVVLAGLSYFSDYDQPSQVATNLNLYSAESLVLEEDDLYDESLAYDLVLANVYDAEDADGDQ